jgi:hypothetical protein
MPGARTPTPPPSGAPSPHYRQHHELEAPSIDMASFRPFWRVRRPIDKLLIAGEITAYEWRCASAFRALYEIALAAQIKAACLDGSACRAGHLVNLQPSERRLAALRRLHDLHARLDDHDVRILEMAIVAEVKWCVLARSLIVHPKTARGRAIAAIRILGQIW